MKFNELVDNYLAVGCGRCELGNTPACKVHRWTRELEELRQIVVSAGLNEEVKWGVPVYTSDGKNIATVAALKDYCAVSFFKGALLNDPDGLLEAPGENSQSARLLKFTDTERIRELEPEIRRFLAEATEHEKAGTKVAFKSIDEHEIPAELAEKLQTDEAFRRAFNALTPGRRRGYYIFIGQAKQSATRLARIEKCKPDILAGRGIHDR